MSAQNRDNTADGQEDREPTQVQRIAALERLCADDVKIGTRNLVSAWQPEKIARSAARERQHDILPNECLRARLSGQDIDIADGWNGGVIECEIGSIDSILDLDPCELG